MTSYGNDQADDAGTDIDVGTDILAGALAGAAAIWTLDRVDWFNYRHLDDEDSRRATERARPGGMDPAHVAANRLARGLGAEPPLPARQNAYGLAVHYGIGVAPAALYGALRGRAPYVDAGRGAAFGLVLFLAQDEGLNTILRLSGRPRDYPWQAHARGVIAHVAYGMTLDALLRVLRPRRRRREPRRYAA
ncbi:MAG: DUF1440 domain-containing protein [Rhodobacteraceae bacterium]|nr:DUF1440 domain-containing protein [Paracoccaceae bacterium]